MTIRNKFMKTFVKIPLSNWSSTRFEVLITQGEPVPATVVVTDPLNSEREMKTPPVNKIHPAFWLAIVTTSCVSTNASRPAGGGSNEPVKGATLLMQRP
jgi:hypothetical protein